MTGERLFVGVYTDEHVMPQLARVLRQYGYEALSAQESGTKQWDDTDQLAYATERGMALLTYNVADFASLAREWYDAGREHGGIILSEPFTQREFGELLRQVLKLLNRLTADELRNAVVYLQQFR